MASFCGRPAYRHGYFARSYFGDDAGGYFHRFAHGAHLFFRVYEGGEGFSALLRFPELVHLFDARAGGSHEHFPDVCVLGIGGRVLLPAHRFLLHQARGHCRFQESFYRDTFCRPRIPYRYPDLRLLYGYVHLCACRGEPYARRIDAAVGIGVDVCGRCR